MRKRLLKKRLRDISDEDIIMLSFERRLGKKMRAMVRQEMGLRFVTTITSVEITVLRRMLEDEENEAIR